MSMNCKKNPDGSQSSYQSYSCAGLRILERVGGQLVEFQELMPRAGRQVTRWVLPLIGYGELVLELVWLTWYFHMQQVSWFPGKEGFPGGTWVSKSALRSKSKWLLGAGNTGGLIFTILAMRVWKRTATWSLDILHTWSFDYQMWDRCEIAQRRNLTKQKSMLVQ